MAHASPGPDDAQPEERTKAKWDQLPAELKGLRRWLTWSLQRNTGGKPTKVPDQSTRDRGRFRDFADVQNTPCGPSGGIGLVFTGGIDLGVDTRLDSHVMLLAFDLDACVEDDGAVAPWARWIIEQTGNSYTEISPSGHGLRTLVAVTNPPPSVPLIKLGPARSDNGVPGKAPQIQVFGCGPAGYVTVTGVRLPGTGEIEVVENLDWLFKRFHTAPQEPPAAVPAGHGPRPTLDEIAAALAGDDRAATLAAGDWETLHLQSASEGWFSLSLAVLTAARGHVHAAVQYLITRTAYGKGLVDSRDPGKYTRESWVLDDLCRVASKQGAKATLLFDDQDFSSWSPPALPAPSVPDGWLLRMPAFKARVAGLEWLYHGLLPARGIVQVYGAPSCGKTAVAVSLAVHVAAGLDWLGFSIERPGWVFYIAGEGGAGLANRFTVAMRQADPTLTDDEIQLHLSTRSGAFSDPENRQIWSQQIAKIAAETKVPPALIVIDTQARNFGHGSENDSEDMSTFVDEIDKLGRAAGALVMLMHHTGHTAQDRARGSSVMFAALDASFEVTRGEGSKVVNIEVKKGKDWDWEQVPVLAGALRPVECGVDDKGRPITAVCFDTAPVTSEDVFDATIDEPPVEQALLGFIATRLQQGVPVKLSRRALAAEHGVPSDTIRKAIEWLVAQKLVTKAGTNKNTTYTLTDEGFRIIGAVGSDWARPVTPSPPSPETTGRGNDAQSAPSPSPEK